MHWLGAQHVDHTAWPVGPRIPPVSASLALGLQEHDTIISIFTCVLGIKLGSSQVISLPSHRLYLPLGGQ